MSTILSSAIIENAKGTVDAYITTANQCQSDLESAIQTLTGADFVGDASNGYNAFFKAKVIPAITDNLTASSGSLTASIKEILDSIKTQLLDTIDPQLGSNNENPG